MQRLKQWLEETGTKQRELADACEVTPGAISQIVNGATEPSLDTLKALSRATGLSVDELLFGDIASANTHAHEAHVTP